MAATIDIIGIDGALKHSAVFEQNSVRKFELMKEDYVRLVFKTASQFAVGLGDHITCDWGTFEITEPQQPTYNQNTGGYDYDLQFNAPHYKWNNKLFKFEPATHRNEASWSLTDTLQNHMAVFLRNLAYYGWTYTVDPVSYQLEAASRHIFIAYDNQYLLDALTKIAEAFECEWWITDNIIHFGKCETGTAVDLQVGVNVETMGAESTDKQFITRLYAFGATRNIPSIYRKNDEQVLLNGVVQKRLMLPTTTPFVDIEEDLETEEIVEGIVLFDDVFPRMENAITSVRSDVRTVERTNTTIEASENSENNEEEESETEEVTIYRFQDSNLTFKEEYLLAGVNLQVQFLSGRLNGMTFDLAFNPDAKDESDPDSQWFEIVRNDSYGLMLPNETLKPMLNDQFVLIGWDITKMESGMSLISVAENELLERATAYAEKLVIDPNTYPCTMMADYMYGLDNRGRQDANFSKVGTFPLGQRIRLVNSTFFKGGSRLSRVVGFEYKLDLPYDGAVIYVGESATYTTKERTAAAVAQVNASSDSINYRGVEYTKNGNGGGSVYVITSNDATTPTDANVYSALKSDRRFARKDTNDSISSLWTFNRGSRRGIQTKDYNENGANEDNLFGKGFELISKTTNNGDTRTRLEVDELFVRIKAFFAQLEIRELSYVGGNYAFSSAGGKIYFVEWYDANDHLLTKIAANVSHVARFRCFLYSDDGTTATINKWALNDQALCQIFNIDTGVHNGATNKRYWRRVVGIGKSTIQSKNDNTEYQYVDLSNITLDYETGSDYPEEEDTIVQLGNWTNSARQGLIYLMVEGNSAPAIMEYTGVGANGNHFVLPAPTLMLSPTKNIIYGEFHSVVDAGGNTGSGSSIDDQLRALIDQLNEVKNQADKKFDIWFGTGLPLPSKNNQSAQANYPASEWTTEALKALHAQDLFYDTTREPAADGGRCWRWVAASSNNAVTYYWDEVTDADTIAALEQISDVASDGKITGGAEKTRVFLEWKKAEQEYWEYKEKAEDYEVTTEWSAYATAFLALGKMLNANSDLTLGNNGYATPAWLSNLNTTTDIPSPATYREKWSAYYAALAAMMQSITEKAKAKADAAKTAADNALATLEQIGSDGYLDPSEKLTVKREFIAGYHEMNDESERGRPAGIIDQAMDANGSYRTTAIANLVTEYINAYKNVAKFLNGGTNWNFPTTTDPTTHATVIKEEMANTDLPIWLQDDETDGSGNVTTKHISNTETINGDTWRTLWATFYSCRTAVLVALSETAQSTADDAQDKIHDIVSDGVISAGSEKSLLYINWCETVAEYKKYIEQASDYFGATNTQDDALVLAYKKLATMLNNGNPATQYASVSDSILNGTTRPLWLDASHINADTVLSETPILTADAYRAIWNDYHVALNTLLEVITSKAKELADHAQADATEALNSIEKIASDGWLMPDEKIEIRREFVAAYHEMNDDGGLLDKATDDRGNYDYIIYNTHVLPYVNAFNALGTYLNGGTTWTSPATDPNDSTVWILPSWIDDNHMDDGVAINGDTFCALWATFYSARTVVLTELSKNAQQTAENAHERVDDIVSDGIISGGTEKSTLQIDWKRTVAEYKKYIEQAEDYTEPSGTQNRFVVNTTTFTAAYEKLAKMLNGGVNATTAILNGTTMPSWLTDLSTDTNLSDTTLDGVALTPVKYRAVWNDYYVALSALLEVITKRAKDLADAAQSTADTAISRLAEIASDGVLTSDEKIEVKREFVAAYHEMKDSGGILDKSKDSSNNYIIASSIVNAYLNAFTDLGRYLDGTNTWTIPELANFDNNLPSMLANLTTSSTINGDTFCNKWSVFYSARTAVITALSKHAQETADDAHDRIDDIVSDGVISGGSEKSLLYIDWQKTVEEYKKAMEQVNEYEVDDSDYTDAYQALATMLNNGVSSNAVNAGTQRPSWISAANMSQDTVLANTPTVNAATYRTTWNTYYSEYTAILKAIVVKAKDLADQAQTDANTALSKLGAIADDGKLDPSEKLTVKREFIAAWHERDDAGGILDKCIVNNTYIISQSLYVTPYRNAFAALAQYLNGGTAWNNITIPNSNAGIESALPDWIKSANMATTNTITGATWRSTWSAFYTARTAILTALSENAKNAADDAQNTADEALDAIDQITSDGVLSRLEKKEVRKEWETIVRVKAQNLAIATAFDLASYTSYGTSGGQGLINAYNTAFNRLGKYLNGDYESNPTGVWDGTSIPAWLNDFTTDQEILPGAYRGKWEDYYEAESSLLNAISSLAKKSGDDALAMLSEIAADGKITPSEKDTLLVSWREVVCELPIIYNQADDYMDQAADSTEADTLQDAMDDYIDSFEAMALILNNGTTYSYSIVGNNFPLPSWLGTRMGTTEELTSAQVTAFNSAWDDYFTLRTQLQEAITNAARRPGDDAMDELEDLADDGILTPIEKITVLREWDKVTTEYATILAQAGKAHVSTQAYTTAYGNLGSYLNDPSGQSMWAVGVTPRILVTPQLEQNTNINATTYKQKWTAYYDARSAILAAIANSKIGYYVSVAVPDLPYYVGDLWMKLANANDTAGTMMICTTTRETGTKSSNDWSSLSDITEKRDPRLMFAAVGEKIYLQSSDEIADRGYIIVTMSASTPSSATGGDIWYNGSVVKKYVDSAWVTLSDAGLLAAFNGLYLILGDYTFKVFSTQSQSATKYDLCTRLISFYDAFSDDVISGNVEIMLYGDSGWELLKESTRALLENLGTHIREFVFGSDGTGIAASGLITSQYANYLFARRENVTPNVLAGTSTGLAWNFSKSRDCASLVFDQTNRQFVIHNYFPVGDNDYPYNYHNANLKSPVMCLEVGKKYVLSFNYKKNNAGTLHVQFAYGTTANNCTINNNLTKQIGGFTRIQEFDEGEYLRYYLVFTAQQSYLQLYFVLQNTNTEKTTGTRNSSTTEINNSLILVESVQNYNGQYYTIAYTQATEAILYIRKPQVELDVTNSEKPSSYKEGQVTIESYIKQTAEEIIISADHINFIGKTTINGNFVVDANGDVTMRNTTVNGVFKSEDVERGNSVIIDALQGLFKMRGPQTLQDQHQDLPYDDNRGDLFKVEFATDADSLQRYAILTVQDAKARHYISLDPMLGIIIYDWIGGRSVIDFAALRSLI